MVAERGEVSCALFGVGCWLLIDGVEDSFPSEALSASKG